MEWFDVKSVAALFGVTPPTVRAWIKTGKLPAVRRPIRAYNPVTGRQIATKTRYVNRVHLEDFFMRRWKAQGMTLADLITAKQATGDIVVWVTPELPSELDRVTLGAETLKAIEDARARRYRGQTKVDLGEPARDKGRRPPIGYRPPAQLELFS